MKLPKYNSALREPELTKYWQEKELYKYKDTGSKKFAVDTPPPTVSGDMHIGHAFSYTQGDVITRFKRMLGYDVFYPFGTDDNGIPTEKLVEKGNDVVATEMSREEFREICEETITKLKPRFVDSWKELGMSCDFNATYSTLSKHSIKTSQKSFIELYEKGVLERKESPVAWCTKTQTAIAQAEFESKETSTYFNTLAFQAENGTSLFIGTTRPELIPACVALFAHPDDDRFTDLKGQKAKVPLSDRTVPILFDESVDQEKGTGLMMVCTFGDKEDIEKWRKYDLPLRAIIKEDGTLNSRAGKYEGLRVQAARGRILEDLKHQGYLVKQRKIEHTVSVYERSGEPIEFLVTKQWFINLLDHKEELIEYGDKVNWHPSHMQKRYENWVENLGWDWCISRQRHFGVPLPVWYDDETGEPVLPNEEDLPVFPEHDEPEHDGAVTPEMDVMDTWNTSSLTPQIALNWAENDEKFDELFPEQLRHQAHDIIRTWAFYTIAKSYFHEEKAPWEDAMISGFVLDPKGNKMSKSKGNTIEPKKMIRKFSADALRYAATQGKLGDDIPFKEKDAKTGQKTVRKLWNASNFVVMNLEEDTPIEAPSNLEPIDEWILTKLDRTIEEVTEGFSSFDFPQARQAIDKFFWQDFCDNYLEMVKHRIYADETDQDVLAVLRTVLLDILKLYAPVMPFVTEEIFVRAYGETTGKDSIHIASWPETKGFDDGDIKRRGDLVVDVLSKIRKHKSEEQLSLNTELDVVTVKGPRVETELDAFREVIQETGVVDELVFEKDEFFKVVVGEEEPEVSEEE